MIRLLCWKRLTPAVVAGFIGAFSAGHPRAYGCGDAHVEAGGAFRGADEVSRVRVSIRIADLAEAKRPELSAVLAAYPGVARVELMPSDATGAEARLETGLIDCDLLLGALSDAGYQGTLVSPLRVEASLTSHLQESDQKTLVESLRGIAAIDWIRVDAACKTLVVWALPEKLDLAPIESSIRASGTNGAVTSHETFVLVFPEMSDDKSAARVESVLKTVDGVSAARVDAGGRQAVVVSEKGRLSAESLAIRVTDVTGLAAKPR